MAALTRAAASYKKKDGFVELSADRLTLSWTPATSDKPSVTISTSDITGLQQTPPPKAVLKLVSSKDGAPPDYRLSFTSLNARQDLESILDPLKEVIAARAANTLTPAAIPTVSTGTGFVTAPEAPASIANNDELSDSSLLQDRELHKTILSSNGELNKLFQDAVMDAPDKAAFYRKFWAARIDMLRAHVIAQRQHQGESNVLSEVKPTVEDGKMAIKMSREQIRVIFKQHPLVLRVYNDLVPKRFDESAFWGAFWVSHLVKKLKGERITEYDAESPEIDKYGVNYDESKDRTRQFFVENVPRFMDIEGNEQNHSQRKGNTPDWTMRGEFQAKVPLLHVLNNMSERLMVNVSASDGEAHGPVGMDEDTFNELQLRDLERVDRDNRIMLNVSSQSHLTSEGVNGTAAARTHDRINALKAIQADMRIQSQLPTDLEEDDEVQAHHATKNILKTVKVRVGSTSTGSGLDLKLLPDLLDSVKMTHSTTIEFLRYFWSVYLSGDDRKANELSQWAQALSSSLERIERVAADAEQKRTEEIARKRKELDDYNQPRKNKKKLDLSAVTGGRKVVEDMMAPTTRAVSFARGDYARNYREQASQQGPAVS